MSTTAYDHVQSAVRKFDAAGRLNHTAHELLGTESVCDAVKLLEQAAALRSSAVSEVRAAWVLMQLAGASTATADAELSAATDLAPTG